MTTEPMGDEQLINICQEFAEYHFAEWYRSLTTNSEMGGSGFEYEYRTIVATPATTPAGWHAKALAYAAWSPEAFDGYEDGWGSALLASLLRDMIAPARSAIITRLAAEYGPLPEGYDANGVFIGYSEDVGSQPVSC